MHTLLIGATGATGKNLLELLIQDNDVERIDVFVRRNIDIQHDKLHINIIDFEKSEQWKHLVKGDVLFSCLGTTLKAAGGKEAQWKVDYDYQFQFAKAAKENNVNSLVLVSSGFASSKSLFFYPRMKGQLEDDIKMLGFEKLIIFNPPMLIRKNTDRKAEVIGLKIFNFLNSLGLFRSNKPLPTNLLAEAILRSVKKLTNGVYSIKAKEILRYIAK